MEVNETKGLLYFMIDYPFWDYVDLLCSKDWEGVKNLISALPPSVKRVVLVSSVGVTKSNELPWR